MACSEATFAITLANCVLDCLPESRQVRVTAPEQIDGELIAWLEQAFEAAG